MTITLVIADDHPIVRQGLRALLETEPDLSVVGETGDGLETARLVERLEPNVLILDLSMPGLNGLEVIPILTRRVPSTRIVVLSMYADAAFVAEAIKNGATGYVLKGGETTGLVEAVRAAARGERYLAPDLIERGIEAPPKLSPTASLDPHDTLTPREREVLQLAAEGHTNAAIAGRLFLSTRTVEMHRANLMRKLGLKSSADLVRYALRRKMIPLEN